MRWQVLSSILESLVKRRFFPLVYNWGKDGLMGTSLRAFHFRLCQSGLTRAHSSLGMLALLGSDRWFETKPLVATISVGCNHLALHGCVHSGVM
jgi:hypothetical protein